MGEPRCVVVREFHGRDHFYDEREPSWTPDLYAATSFTASRARAVAAEMGGVAMVLHVRRTVEGELGRENDHGRKC